jgi:chemotaxis protein histidine kinase CheA
MATKQVKVDIDVKSGSVKIAGEETMKLSRQVSVLIKELENTPKGTAQFEILSSKLNETKDKMAAVKAQSSELFGTFSMLPGPIGAIGSAADGTLSTLKTFSTFSFKDITTQFKGLFKDVGEVASNIGKATGITKLFNATTTLLAGGLNKVGISANVGSKGLKLFSGALLATGVGALVVGLGLLISNFDKVRDAVYKMFPPLKALGDAIGSVVNFFTDLIGVTSEAERAEAKRQATFAKAKANTEIVNQGIQREIDLLKAKGATQEEIDKKEKQMIQNQLKDLTAVANERGTLYGEQATQYKDLQNKLLVIDATAAKAKADKDKKDAEDAANKSKTAGDKARQIAEQNAQKDREFRQQQADAQVQILKDSTDTDEQTLRMAIEKQYAIKNEGKKLSVEVAQQQANEIDRIVKEELAKDVEARKKANDEKIAQAKDANKIEIEELSVTLEEKKLKFGAESEEVRKTQADIFASTRAGFDAEKALLDEKSKTKDGLTRDEINRLKEIENANRQLTVTVQTENQRQVAADVEKNLKLQEETRAANQTAYEEKMSASQGDFELQQTILDAKVEQDRVYYEQLLATENLTAEQRKAILAQQTENVKANAAAQIDIETKKFQAQQALLGATANALNALADIAGKNTKAGKALAVAASLINTYAAIAGQLRAFAGLPIPGYAIIQAIATGLVGFKAVKDIIATPIPEGGGGGTAPAAGNNGPAVPKPRGLAKGGYVTGPGSGTSDSIPTLLSNGESVINASSTKMFKPLLSTINAIGGGRKFADGGVVGGMNQSLTQLQDSLMTTQQPVKAYVVAQDMSNQQMMDRRIKERSTL